MHRLWRRRLPRHDARQRKYDLEGYYSSRARGMRKAKRANEESGKGPNTITARPIVDLLLPFLLSVSAHSLVSTSLSYRSLLLASFSFLLSSASGSRRQGEGHDADNLARDTDAIALDSSTTQTTVPVWTGSGTAYFLSRSSYVNWLNHSTIARTTTCPHGLGSLHL